jgi:hypothetical protein
MADDDRPPHARTDGERMAVLEHEVVDIRRDLGRLEADQVLIRTDIGVIKESVTGLKGQFSTVAETATAASTYAQQSAASTARVEARLNEPGAGSYLVRKLADSLTAWVLVMWGGLACLVVIAIIAVIALAGGYATNFAAGVGGDGGTFSVSSDPKVVPASAEDGAGDAADTGAGMGGGFMASPQPSL